MRKKAQSVAKHSKKPSSDAKSPAATPSPATTRAAAIVASTPAELKRQQRVLDIFNDVFRDVLRDANFTKILQEVKQALFNRDFAQAFGSEEHLEVYAARWSPTRALCYSRVLGEIGGHVRTLVASGDSADEEEDEEGEERGQVALPSDRPGPQGPRKKRQGKKLRMLAFGGGAAEVVAFADYLHVLHFTRTNASIGEAANGDDDGDDNDDDDDDDEDDEDKGGGTPIFGDAHLVDTAPWGGVVRKLRTGLTTAPTISKYASVAAKEANRPLVPAALLRLRFTQRDILSLDQAQLSNLLTNFPSSLTEEEEEGGGGGGGGGIQSRNAEESDQADEADISQLQPLTPPPPLLITLLFTLNELYNTPPPAGGIAKTTSFLRNLSSCVPPGSLLLVVDSPGSYSEAAVGGKEKKRYPMHWLLDHTLLRSSSANGGGGAAYTWEKLETHESVWFRLADGLRYPISLENMRYQMHLYRACPPPTTSSED